jgi:hypothetical protein
MTPCIQHTTLNALALAVSDLLKPLYTESEMPDQIPDVTYFTNIAGYAGANKPFSSINDKNLVLPRFPQTTHYEKNDENAYREVDSQCDSVLGCDCTTVLDVGSI